MRRAAKVDSNQREITAALERVGCLVLSLAALGRGCPDLLVMAGRRLHLIECKTERGKLTAAQELFHKLWPVHICRSPEDALRAVGLRP